MKFTELLRLVWINIVENKAKMMLTSLGIIVGAATIVLVIAIGKGGQAEVADQFKNLNAGAIEVSVGTGVDMDAMMQGGMGGMGQMPSMGGNMPSMGGGMPSMGGGMGGAPGGGMGGPGGNSSRSGNSSRRTSNTVTLSTEDLEDVREYVSGLSEMTILQSGDTTVFGGSLEEEQTAKVVGVLSDYQQVSNLSVLYGRFLSEDDEAYKDYVCVLGYALAAEIFEYAAYACGDYVEIDGKNYEVVGVLEQMGTVSSGISPDSAVYVPYSTAEKYIFGGTAEASLAGVAADVSEVEQAMTDIEAVLKENHPNGYFDVTDAGSAMEAATNSANTLAVLLLAVASIVFVVGGIGIMNVLFVSVQERTPEIGILKAVGCSQKDILLEFLLEAAIISILGGVVGVLLSFALIPLIELVGQRMENSATGCILALAFAVLTGTAFGFYPAWKASKLVPIQALNLE